MLRLINALNIKKMMILNYLINEFNKRTQFTFNIIFTYYFYDNKNNKRNIIIIIIRELFLKLLK